VAHNILKLKPHSTNIQLAPVTLLRELARKHVLGDAINISFLSIKRYKLSKGKIVSVLN
jgi:hypothetical protein